jgi:hypothetical protein
MVVRPVRLFLEQLERRDCPTGLTLNYTVSQAGGHSVSITGSVIDPNLGRTVVVSFTGVVTATVTADAGGSFSVLTTASAVGTVAGQATDDQGLYSDLCEVEMTNTAPRITNFQVIGGLGTVWTISGHIQDEVAGGLVVTLNGLPELNGRTVTADANGNFVISVTLADGESGTVTALTIDCWGVNSNLAEFYVNPA